MALHLRKTVLDYLRDHPDKRFAAREIAEWIFATYPEECQAKKDRSQVLKTDTDLIGQIISEIGAHIPPCQKNEPQLKITDDKPRKFYYSTLSSDANEALVTENPREQIIVISDKKNNNEHAMYPLISQYLSKELGVFSKRINEKRSSNNLHEKKSNHWLHPDIVGIEDLGIEWHQEVRDCVQKYSDKRSKLWSFEAKIEINRSNVRECFFQAVSNSSWANYGYLIAKKITGQGTLKELRLLFAAHGIGLIQLDADNLIKSQILIPAREREAIDWDMVNRLSKENSDFSEYVRLIKEFCLTGRLKSTDWDL